MINLVFFRLLLLFPAHYACVQLVFSPSVHDAVKGMVVGKRKWAWFFLFFFDCAATKRAQRKEGKTHTEQRRKKVRWESSSPAPIFSVTTLYLHVNHCHFISASSYSTQGKKKEV